MTLKIEVTDDSRTAVVNSVKFTAGQTVGFKPTDEEKVGVGKIEQFIFPGWKQCERGSLWMRVVDIITREKHWVPISLWLEQNKNGLFDDIKFDEYAKQQTATVAKPSAKSNSKGEGVIESEWGEDLETGGDELW